MSSFQHTPLEFLTGVGPQRAAALREEFGLSTVKDLLQHYPFRNIDRSDIVAIGTFKYSGRLYTNSRDTRPT